MLVSTHSVDLLSHRGISGEEVLLLNPGAEGTKVAAADSVSQIRSLLEAGMNIADIVVPHTEPKQAGQLELFTL